MELLHIKTSLMARFQTPLICLFLDYPSAKNENAINLSLSIIVNSPYATFL